MDEAQRIVRLATLERRRRRYFDDESASDEPRLDPSEVEQYVGRYLADHRMGNHVEIRWGAAAGGYVQPAMVTTTSPSKGASGVLHLPPQASAWTEGSLGNLLNHEVGTHFVRSANEQQWCEYRQMFGGAYRRVGAKCVGGSEKQVSQRELVATEEGLATLNTLLESKGKLLASAALSYVAAVLAQSMGFTQLFVALKATPRHCAVGPAPGLHPAVGPRCVHSRC